MANNNEIYMNIPAVEKIASGFATAAHTLQAVSKALQVILQTLRAVAFMGLVGGFAVQRYIEWLKPKIDNLAKFCEEISKDVKFAIAAYSRGDAAGSMRFH